MFGQECIESDFCCAGDKTTTTTTTTTTSTTTYKSSCKFLENSSLNDEVIESLFSDAVLITGSSFDPPQNTAEYTAELYQPSTGLSCFLPQLHDRRESHTLESSGLLCGGEALDSSDTCLQWSPDTGSWQKLHLGTRRYDHVSWTPDNGMGTYLMGCDFHGLWAKTTTLVKHDGTQEAAFPLKYETR